MENPTPELTLGQRLAADTPTFFKKTELVGTAIVAIGGSLTQVPGLPAWLTPILFGIGGAIMLLSKFAVKDASVLANPNATVADYSAVLADLPNQAAQLEQGIKNTTDAIASGKIPVAQPPAATPIVPAPVVINPTALQQAVAQQPIGNAVVSVPDPASSINPNSTL